MKPTVVQIDMQEELAALLREKAKKNKRKLSAYITETLALSVGRRDLAFCPNAKARQKAISDCERGLELLRNNQATGWNITLQAMRQLAFIRDIESAKKYSRALKALFARGAKRNPSTESDIAAIDVHIEEQDTSIYLERLETWRCGCPERAGNYAIIKNGSVSFTIIRDMEDTAMRDDAIEFYHLLSELPTSRRSKGPGSLDQP